MVTRSPKIDAPFVQALNITPNDNFGQEFEAFMAATSGSVTFVTFTFELLTVEVQAYEVVPLNGQRIFATGTNATGLVILNPGKQNTGGLSPIGLFNFITDEDGTNNLSDGSGNNLVDPLL